MKLISFYRGDGSAGVGLALDEGRVLDLKAVAPDLPHSVKGLLQAGALQAARGWLGSEDEHPEAVLAPGGYTPAPAVPEPGKFLLCGVNYKNHVLEMGRPLPEKPSLFGRFNHTLLAAGQPILVSPTSSCVDWEGELVAVIGKAGKYIPRGRAMEHVAGLTCFNDVSMRDVQTQMPQLTLGKNFDASGPLGPWMVTLDEIDDPGRLELKTLVNGQVMQHGNTSEWIFDLPTLIETISSAMTLLPGDLISTGTPGGVGHARDPQIYLKPGDTVTVSIQGVGELTNPVAAEG